MPRVRLGCVGDIHPFLPVVVFSPKRGGRPFSFLRSRSSQFPITTAIRSSMHTRHPTVRREVTGFIGVLVLLVKRLRCGVLRNVPLPGLSRSVVHARFVSKATSRSPTSFHNSDR